MEALRLIRLREGGIAHVVITVNMIFEEVSSALLQYPPPPSNIKTFAIYFPQFQRKGLPYDKVQLRAKMVQLCSESFFDGSIALQFTNMCDLQVTGLG